MLLAIVGDVVGSDDGFDSHRAEDCVPFTHRRAFGTDDTVCTIAVADALVYDHPPALALKTWGRRYWANGDWSARFPVRPSRAIA